MDFVEFSVQSVIDGRGLSISVTGMLSVFIALAVISLVVSWLPYLLSFVNRIVPEKEEVQKKKRPGRAGAGSGAADEGVAAAVAAAYHYSKK
ncbi:MAG: OadG family protein [Chitinivibrionales bacterium]